MGLLSMLQTGRRLGILLLGAGFACYIAANSVGTQAATGLVVTGGAGGVGTPNDWLLPINAQGTANDAIYATAAPLINGRITGVWNAYGFDSSLPANAAITKVEIIAHYRVDTALSVANLEVQAVVGGNNCPVAPVVDASEPLLDTDFTADVTACRSWQRSDLLDANFGTRVTAHRGDSLALVDFFLDNVRVKVTYNTPEYEQVAYRWYDNTDSASVGSALANQDTTAALYAPQDRVRLRVLLHVADAALQIGLEQFKLQFAAKTGASCAGLSYADVTDSSAIAFYDNPTPANGIALASGAEDPGHSGHTAIAQTYAENSPFSTIANVAAGQDGMWDIPLVSNGAPANTVYCFRLVKNDSNALTAYSVYPEIVTAPSASLGIDIVDASGASVTSPSFAFINMTTPFVCASSAATLGTASQRVRVKNTTNTPGWSLSIAATGGSSALWSAGTPKYDFNDGAGSPAGCSAGLDSDTYGGQMTIDASTGTITPRSVSTCSTTGVNKGSTAAFVEDTVNAITLMNASASADIGCFWELTDVDVTQRIPGGQVAGAYSLNLTMTVVAN